MTATKKASDTLEALRERVARGIEWLRDNDPKGAFNLWWESGLRSFTPMPAQTDEVREAFARYCKNREVFERLWTDMERRERAEGVS